MKLEINFAELLTHYRFPQRMRDELAVLLKANLNKVLSSSRVSLKGASIKTQERRLYSICKTIVEIREAGFKIESPYSLDNRHLTEVVRRWVLQGQTVGTMQNKLSHLKSLAEGMKKFGLVKPLYDYVSKEDLADLGRTRKYVTTEDKSWESHGISVKELIDKVSWDDPHVGIQLKLQIAFGLRVEESMALPVKKTIANMLRRADGKIVIEKGTKGGRMREVPLQFREAVLKEALTLANERTGSTTPGDYTLPRWRNYYYSVMTKHGITQKDLGITSHGLRHQWMQELYKKLTDSDAPIKGGDERPDIDAHKAAMREAIQAAGHSKPSKTGMYLSTWSAMDKLKAPVVTIDDVRRALEESGGNKKEAAGKLGISRQKLYRIIESAGSVGVR